jgi:hypothetical protein
MTETWGKGDGQAPSVRLDECYIRVEERERAIKLIERLDQIWSGKTSIYNEALYVELERVKKEIRDGVIP